MAYALDALGKQSRIINADRAPDHYYEFPGLERIEIRPTCRPTRPPTRSSSWSAAT